MRNSPVLCSPAFHKAHSDSAHPGELVNSLKALIDRLRQECSELLVVENLEVTAWNSNNRYKDTDEDFRATFLILFVPIHSRSLLQSLSLPKSVEADHYSQGLSEISGSQEGSLSSSPLCLFMGECWVSLLSRVHHRTALYVTRHETTLEMNWRCFCECNFKQRQCDEWVCCWPFPHRTDKA